MRESFLGIPLLCAPYLAGEPIGADALDALAAATVADGRPAPALMDDVDVPRMRVEADGADFVLTLPLPLVLGRAWSAWPAARTTCCSRSGASAVSSPSRRCCAAASCSNAAVGSGELRVRFERDEEQWASGR